MQSGRQATQGRHIHTPAQTLGEEIANAVSHGLGLLLALAAVPILVIQAVEYGGARTIVGAAVFASTLILLYGASTLYHALPPTRIKAIFRVVDHCAIYLLIAGTYTPFTLGALRGAWGWTLFGVVWGLAVVGILSKAVGGIRFPRLSTALYLAMGWLVIVAIEPLRVHVPGHGLLWLFGGGIAYTAGVVFFAAERLRYNHFVWHVFVMLGTACHFVAVLRYARG